jgi:hypothetical protein
MPSYDQQPGKLSLSFKAGDDFSALVDFSPITMTGYTVTASLNSLVTGAEVTPLTATLFSAVDGKVNVSLSKTQTSQLARGTYGWSLAWTAPGNVRRSALTGTVEVS